MKKNLFFSFSETCSRHTGRCLGGWETCGSWISDHRNLLFQAWLEHLGRGGQCASRATTWNGNFQSWFCKLGLPSTICPILLSILFFLAAYKMTSPPIIVGQASDSKNPDLYYSLFGNVDLSPLARSLFLNFPLPARLFFFFFYPSRLLFIFHGCLSLPYQKGRTTA